MPATSLATSSLTSLHSPPLVSSTCLASVVISKRCPAHTPLQISDPPIKLTSEDVDQLIRDTTTSPKPKPSILGPWIYSGLRAIASERTNSFVVKFRRIHG